ncbi:MAG: hypothetical protein HC806_02730 [Anaerolineae bacterium]|nr:hypothetical protein [Anaerolineae bacterium]
MFDGIFKRQTRGAGTERGNRPRAHPHRGADRPRAGGIPIDCVAGVSAGAIMGGGVLRGDCPREVREIALNIGWGRVSRLVWPKDGFVSFDKLENS